MTMVTISSKNQITLPVEALALLSTASERKLLIDWRVGEITLKPVTTSVVVEVAGSLTSFVAAEKLGKSWMEIMRQTKKKTAKKLTKND